MRPPGRGRGRDRRAAPKNAGLFARTPAPTHAPLRRRCARKIAKSGSPKSEDMILKSANRRGPGLFARRSVARAPPGFG
ncbi:hypothetical protein A33M_0060 [Rhodovulum sp. PH10]|nr:hypothetical protein A33M_0060 [Rhodovulum sp. PH10]